MSRGPMANGHNCCRWHICQGVQTARSYLCATHEHTSQRVGLRIPLKPLGVAPPNGE